MGELNDNEGFTDPFEPGEWPGEEVLTVSVQLRQDGGRQTGARAGWYGEARGCSQVQWEREREPQMRSAASAGGYSDGIKPAVCGSQGGHFNCSTCRVSLWMLIKITQEMCGQVCFHSCTLETVRKHILSVNNSSNVLKYNYEVPVLIISFMCYMMCYFTLHSSTFQTVLLYFLRNCIYVTDMVSRYFKR